MEQEKANLPQNIPELSSGFPEYDATAKSPDQKFWMDCKKDKIGNFERGYSQSNHR